MILSVKIGEFRNRLSAYLRKVRNGAELVISDRETPIGRLVPVDSAVENEPIELTEPAQGYQGLAALKFPPLSPEVDAVEMLLRERRRR
jgi:prevent-host-death family protein